MGSAVSTRDSGQAYHVLQVTPNSPGEKAGLQSFFDFIVAANGQVLEKDDSSFIEILTSNVGKPVKLRVFNALSQSERELILTPNREWGGAGLAGINVRMSNTQKALTLVWHVVQVHKNGPAEAAGLESVNDFIVGVPGLLFFDPDDFYNLVKVNLNKPLPLYVYSTKTRSIRVATVTPDHNWGGEGFLGCDVAYGLNHQLVTPYSSETPSPKPTMQENSSTQTNNQELQQQQESSNQIATSTAAPPAPAPAPTPNNQHNVSSSIHKDHSAHHHSTSIKSEVTEATEASSHKHTHSNGGPCDHDHDHNHNHDHNHDHNHNHTHSPHYHPSSKISHAHTHQSPTKVQPTSASTAPSTPLQQQQTESNLSTQTSNGLKMVKVTYTPAQLFSPLQKLPQDYQATPLPDELLNGEDMIPFQSRFGQ